jgi:hypothetical protein
MPGNGVALTMAEHPDYVASVKHAFKGLEVVDLDLTV